MHSLISNVQYEKNLKPLNAHESRDIPLAIIKISKNSRYNLHKEESKR